MWLDEEQEEPAAPDSAHDSVAQNGYIHDPDSQKLNETGNHKSNSQSPLEDAACAGKKRKAVTVERPQSDVEKAAAATQPRSGITKVLMSKNDSPHLPPASSPQKIVKFMNGLQYTVQRAGKGMGAFAGAKVKVHYVGRLSKTRKVFDRTNKQPFSFKLGGGEVIKGWDLGVKGMKVGEKRELRIPSQLAYKNQALPGIPKGSDLTFEVELMAFT